MTSHKGDESAVDNSDAFSSSKSPSPRRCGSRDARARERLFLLRHASTCGGGGGGDGCPTRHCREYRRLWLHLCECAASAGESSSSSTCSVPHCSTSMALLAHFGSCGSGRASLVPVPVDDGSGEGNGWKEFCDVCRPVWEDIARTEREDGAAVVVARSPTEAETVGEIESDDSVVVVAANDDEDNDDRDFLTIVRLITSRHRRERQERKKMHRQGSKKALPSLPEADGKFTKTQAFHGPRERRVSSSSAATAGDSAEVATSPSTGTVENPSADFPPVPSEHPSPESGEGTSTASAAPKALDSAGEGGYPPLSSKAPTPFSGRKSEGPDADTVAPSGSFPPLSLKAKSSPPSGAVAVDDASIGREDRPSDDGPPPPPVSSKAPDYDLHPRTAAPSERDAHGATATSSTAPTVDEEDSSCDGGVCGKKAPSGMDLNVAYEAAERMRRLNLEVECSERGVTFVDHDTCTECLLSGDAAVVRFPRLQRLADDRNAGGSDGVAAVTAAAGTSATPMKSAGIVVPKLPNFFAATRGTSAAAGGTTAVEKEWKDSPAPVASTFVPSIQTLWRGVGAGAARSDATGGNVATAKQNGRQSSLFPRMRGLMEVAARIDEADGNGRAMAGCAAAAKTSVGIETEGTTSSVTGGREEAKSGIKAKVSAVESGRNATQTEGNISKDADITCTEAKVDDAESAEGTISAKESECPATGAGGEKTEIQRNDVTETKEDRMPSPATPTEDDGSDARAYSTTSITGGGVAKLLPGRRNKGTNDGSSTEAANDVAITEKRAVVLPRIQKLMDDRQKARTSPCLICASPSCPRHSSAKFRKSNITLCHSCERLFDLDFVVDCVSMSADASERAGHIDHMVDLYDRSLLLLRYSVQFIDQIAGELERSTETRNKVGLGSSGAGVVSGVLGVAAAATILTPAGPPLLITSLLFGGGATAVQTGTEAMNSLSEPNRLADRIIALHGMVCSILRVTGTLRDAMVLDHIRTDAYLEEEKKRQIAVSTPGLVAGANVGQCLTLGGAEISAIGARAGATMSRVGTAAARTLRFAKFAGGALSAAVLVLEANAIQNTLQQIHAGNPCEKATTLRKIRDELDDLPSAESLDRECQTYLRVLEERLSRPKVDGDEVLQLAEDGDQALARDAAEGNFDKIADLLDASSESVGSRQTT